MLWAQDPTTGLTNPSRRLRHKISAGRWGKGGQRVPGESGGGSQLAAAMAAAWLQVYFIAGGGGTCTPPIPSRGGLGRSQGIVATQSWVAPKLLIWEPPTALPHGRGPGILGGAGHVGTKQKGRSPATVEGRREPSPPPPACQGTHTGLCPFCDTVLGLTFQAGVPFLSRKQERPEAGEVGGAGGLQQRDSSPARSLHTPRLAPWAPSQGAPPRPPRTPRVPKGGAFLADRGFPPRQVGVKPRGGSLRPKANRELGKGPDPCRASLPGGFTPESSSIS